MPDVTISNPKVQINLNESSKTTVPSGARWKVVVANKAAGGQTKIAGTKVLNSGSGNSRSAIRIDLFPGDVVKDEGGKTIIRGYRVD